MISLRKKTAMLEECYALGSLRLREIRLSEI